VAAEVSADLTRGDLLVGCGVDQPLIYQIVALHYLHRRSAGTLLSQRRKADEH
jgi:hypothetical protein